MSYLASPETRVLLFGDSNTYGYDPATDGRYGRDVRWPCVLQKLLGDGYDIVAEGLCGRTAVHDDPLVEGLRGLDMIAPLMLTHAPLDKVVIMLGTNDCKARFGCNATLIAKGITRLTKKALASDGWRGTPDVLVISPAPIAPHYRGGPFGPTMGEGCDVKAAGLAAELEPMVTALPGVRFLDAGRIPGVVCTELDGMHLTAAAHQALAAALAKELKP